MESRGSLDKPFELEVNDSSDAGPPGIPIHQRMTSNDDFGSVGSSMEAWLHDSADGNLLVYPVEDDEDLGEVKVTYSIRTLRCGKVIQAPIGKDQNTFWKSREINEILSMNRMAKGSKNVKNTGSKCKTKRLATSSEEYANSKSQSSKNVEEVVSLDEDKALEDESQILSGVGRGKLQMKSKISVNQSFVDEDNSSKGLKQTSLVDPDDDIDVKMTLKECLLQMKAKKKAKVAPAAEDTQFPRKVEKLGSFKQKLTKTARSLRENSEPIQTSGYNGIEESSISGLQRTGNKSYQCNAESQCGLDATETNFIPPGSESSDFMSFPKQNYSGKLVLEKEIRHKWAALGAKIKLPSGSMGGIQEQQSDGSHPKKRQKKEVKTIQLPEEFRNVKEMEQDQLKESGLCSEASDIRLSVVDADAACNVHMDLLPVETLDMEGDYQRGSFQQQPAKLPLARKVISPMAQESLLHATDSQDGCNTLPQITEGKCRDLLEQKSIWEKQGLQGMASLLEDTYLRHPSIPDINGPVTPCYNKSPPCSWRKKSPISKGVRSSPKLQSPFPLGSIVETNSIKNQREEASPSPTLKGILKSPVLPCPTACGCVKCASIRAQAEKACEFAKRQMHDIESLGARLTRELKVMRTIVEENVIPKADQSTVLSSEFTIEEIKAAVGSASELEEKAKKWVTMMSRDCNRFCKILKHHREGQRRRKIIFADEVGRDLFCVRFFDVHRHCDSSVATSEKEGNFENFEAIDDLARKEKKIDFWEKFGAVGDSSHGSKEWTSEITTA